MIKPIIHRTKANHNNWGRNCSTIVNKDAQIFVITALVQVTVEESKVIVQSLDTVAQTNKTINTGKNESLLSNFFMKTYNKK